MSDEQLYEIARIRVQQRNRRWLLWAVNLCLFLLYVGAFTAFSGIPRNMGEFAEQAWFAALVLHSVSLVLTQDEEDGIAREVARVRRAIDLTPAPLHYVARGEKQGQKAIEPPRSPRKRNRADVQPSVASVCTCEKQPPRFLRV